MAGFSFYLFWRTVVLTSWFAATVLTPTPAAQRPQTDKNGHYPGFASYADSLVASPDSPHKYMLLAEYWLQQGEVLQHDDAIASGLTLFPDDTNLLRLHAENLTRNASFDEAAALYERLLAQTDDTQTLLDYANNEKLADRIDHAHVLYERTYAADPNAEETFDAYYRFLGLYVDEKLAYRLAIRHGRTARPTSEQWLIVGDAWIERNRPYKALEAYESANPDSNFIAAIMSMNIQQFLRPGLHGRFEFIEDEARHTSTHYNRVYTSLDYRPGDWWTCNVEYLYDQVRRRYNVDGYTFPATDREVHAVTGAMYFLPFTSLYLGGQAQYLANHVRWGGWTLTCEQDLTWDGWSLWWRLIRAMDTVEYWDFKQQAEYAAQAQAEWREWTLLASFSSYYTQNDEVFVEPEYPWQQETAVMDNRGYRAQATLDHVVLDEPTALSFGAYMLARGYEHESRFYSSPDEQLFYGLLGEFATPVNDMNLGVSGQLGMDEDYNTNWVLGVDASIELPGFTASFGASFDDDGYSSSRMLSFTVSELSL